MNKEGREFERVTYRVICVFINDIYAVIVSANTDKKN